MTIEEARSVIVPFGRNIGVALGNLSPASLAWYAEVYYGPREHLRAAAKFILKWEADEWARIGEDPYGSDAGEADCGGHPSNFGYS